MAATRHRGQHVWTMVILPGRVPGRANGVWLMEFLSGLPHYLRSFLVILRVLVFVHELGHFLVARRCGVRVEVFSIGFGPELFGFNDRRGTRWKFSALPLGGYVKMFGHAETTTDDDGVERPITTDARDEALARKTVV